MTASATILRTIIWPETPLIDETAVIKATLSFLFINPQGVRNCDVARALGITRFLDSRNWTSFGILQRLIERGSVVKDPLALYRLTAAGRTHLCELQDA